MSQNRLILKNNPDALGICEKPVGQGYGKLPLFGKLNYKLIKEEVESIEVDPSILPQHQGIPLRIQCTKYVIEYYYSKLFNLLSNV